MLPDDLKDVDGAQALHDWFGEWPQFHDAELLSLTFNGREPSRIVLHTWRITDRVDQGGHFVTDQNVVVELILDDIVHVELQGERAGTILFELQFKKEDSGICLQLDSSCGLGGSIKAGSVRIALHPGKPQLEG